jgi:uncharacterized protein YsxB (DUF464 family)
MSGSNLRFSNNECETTLRKGWALFESENNTIIVAAATMIVFIAIPILLIGLQELGDSKEDYSDKASHSA